MKRNSTSAFTLLEVMVAVAILGIALTAIFSSEAGAIKMAHRSRKVGIGVQLARCKMGEIEEKIAKEGLPAVFASETDECCEGAEVEGFSCDWEINRIVLPDEMFEGSEEEEPEPGTQSVPASDMDFSTLDPTDPMELLSGGGENLMGDMASMAMEFVYPVLKPAFEEQIRRVTVKVRWNEGNSEHTFDVTQYVVAEQPPPQEEQQ